MLIKLLVVTLASAAASKPEVRTYSTYDQSVKDIDIIADIHSENLKESYRYHQLLSAVKRDQCLSGFFSRNRYYVTERFELLAPYSCRFRTHAPHLLDSVWCRHAAACQLAHNAAAIDTYSPVAGYHWTAKASTKSFKILEIGGKPVSTETHSCSCRNYKRNVVTELVKCSDHSGASRGLQLFVIKSDLHCDFGKVTFEKEYRDGLPFVIIPLETFTWDELENITASRRTNFEACAGFLLDVTRDHVSEGLIRKLTSVAPFYKPLTDLLHVSEDGIGVFYFKVTSYDWEYSSYMPFTNEYGNNVYQYACIMIRR